MSRANYNDSNAKDKVWEKAKKITNMDPKIYRMDPYGKTLKYSEYGKQTNMSWQIDHIKPISKGGSDDIINLQALSTEINEQKGGSLKKKSRHSECNK